MLNVKTGLRVASFLMVLLGYLGLAATNRYSLAVAAVPVALLALMPLGEWLDRRFARYRTATSFVSVVYVAVSMLLIPFMDLLANVVNLVIFIQAYTFVHRKQTRDYVHLLLMSFFMLLAASVLMPDPEIAVVMLFFMLCAVLVMVLLQIKTESDKAERNGGADILTLDQTDPMQARPRRGFDLGVVNSVAGLSAAAVAATIVLFISIPRMEAGLLGRSDPTLFRMDVSPTVDLARGGRILRTTAAIMRVEFPDEPGGKFNGPMFWRCASLDLYRDPTWQRQGPTPNPNLVNYCLPPREILDSANRRSGFISRPSSPQKRRVRQVVFLQKNPEEGVPALTLVQRMQIPQDYARAALTWDRTADYAIVLSRYSQNWLQYEAWSEIDRYTPEQLRAAPGNYQSVMTPRDYQLFTSNTLQERSVELARRITQGKSNPYDKVVAVAAYLSQGGFQYTLDIPDLPQRQPMDTFLHETRTGHCELFASAMALMVRSLGIPARVVTGYRGAEWSELERAYTVRQDMAHLWVEVYFIGIGWATFDPSPADAQLASLGRNSLLRFLSRQALVAKMLWYRNVVAFNSRSQLAALRNVRVGFVRLRDGLFDSQAGTTSRFRPGPVFAATLVLLLLLAGIGGGIVAWARATRPNRFPLTPDQARAVRLYRKLLRNFAPTGLVHKGMSAEEVHKAIAQNRPQLLKTVSTVINTYNEVRFGKRPLPPQPYRQLKKSLKTQ